MYCLRFIPFSFWILKRWISRVLVSIIICLKFHSVRMSFDFQWIFSTLYMPVVYRAIFYYFPGTIACKKTVFDNPETVGLFRCFANRVFIWFLANNFRSNGSFNSLIALSFEHAPSIKYTQRAFCYQNDNTRFGSKSAADGSFE